LRKKNLLGAKEIVSFALEGLKDILKNAKTVVKSGMPSTVGKLSL